ncbi:hypothetical protein EB061_03025 [bacterium]|jgi:hypothetical protein|nr:hypothetical protein [bacterium]
MDSKGQSLLEVVIMLPFLFLLFGLLFRANMAIQMAINNQQFARSQVYVLTANSPEYPRLGFRHVGIKGGAGRMSSGQIDLMLLGVSDPSALAEVANGDSMPPIPQMQRVARAGAPAASQDPGEPSLRNEVRIRETSSICTQMNFVEKGLNYDSTGVTKLGNKRWPFGKLVCQYGGAWIGDLNE